MYEDDFIVTYNSEQVAMDFNISHKTLVNWIKNGYKRHPDLINSITKVKDNNRIIYIIDEAGYSYLCTRHQGMKLASREQDFKDYIMPFIEELGYHIEYQYQILKYRVDFYIPALNIVIEHDEEYHNLTKVTQYDIKREQDIITHLGCKFIRIPAKYDTIKALGYITKVIYEKEIKNVNKDSI